MSDYADSPRYDIQYPLLTAPTDVPGDIETPILTIDQLISPTYVGVASSRPTAGTFTPPNASGTAGRRWFATDTGKISFDTGSSWLAEGPINTVQGNITASSPGQGALAGNVGLSADAGHTHARENWGAAGNYQPPGATAQAGNTGNVADAGHVHPGLSVGMGMIWFLGTPPAGYLNCDGTAYPTTGSTAELFNVIGHTWDTYNGQVAPGAGLFRVPKLTDQVAVMAGNTYAVAQAYGSPQITLSSTQLPAHNHGVSDPGHAHGVSDLGHAHGSPNSQFIYGSSPHSTIFTNQGPDIDHSPAWNLGAQPSTTSVGTGISINGNTTGITTLNTGSGAPISIVQPSAGVIYVIKYL